MTYTDNRARLAVDLNGDWRAHVARPLYWQTWKLLGTVTRGEADTGALAASPTHKFYQINGTRLRALDQRKVLVALTQAGYRASL